MFLRKDTRADFYLPHITETAILSFQTVAEMREGALNARWGERRVRELEDFLRDYVVAPVTAETVNQWARIRSEGRRNGRQLAVADAWIAATAAVLNAPLLAH